MTKRLLLCVMLLFFCTAVRADPFTPTYTAADNEVLTAANLNKFGTDVQTHFNSAKVASDNIKDGSIVNADVSASAAIDDTKIEGGTTDATLSAMFTYYRFRTRIYPKDGDEFYVDVGEMRITDENKRITSTLTCDKDNIIDTDGGDEPDASAYYYIYARGDTSDTAFDIVLSKDSSDPTANGGSATDYRRIGWLYNGSGGDSVLDIEAIGDDDYGALNLIGATDEINTNSQSYIDMTDMILYVVSDGIAETQVWFTGNFKANTTEEILVRFLVDAAGTAPQSLSQTGASNVNANITNIYAAVLSAGEHTIKVQWKTSGAYTVEQRGAQGQRVLQVEVR